MLTAFTRAEYLPFSVQALGEEGITVVVDTLHAPNSCTAGLHTTLAPLGAGPGDEAIITPLTFAASVSRRVQDLPSAVHATT